MGTEKIWTLAYADDLVLPVGDERGLREIMRLGGRYVNRKGLEVNANKSKIMIFRNRAKERKRVNGTRRSEIE